MKRILCLFLVLLFSCSNQSSYKSTNTVSIDGEGRIGRIRYIPYEKSEIERDKIEVRLGNQVVQKRINANIDEFVELALREVILSTDIHLTEESEIVVMGEINSISIVESASMTITANITFVVKNTYEEYFRYESVHEINYQNVSRSYEERLAEVTQMCVVDFLKQAKELKTFQPIRFNK